MFQSGGFKSVTCFLCIYVVMATTAPMADGYKHIVFMHGIFAGPSEFVYLNGLIQQYHPGTPMTLVNLFREWESLANLWVQVEQISAHLQPILTNKSSNGTILVCFSQGGLICRALLASLEHNVHTFISLSAPLAGQFGETDYLKSLFPKYIRNKMYKLFYSYLGQVFSVANYWNDPHQQPLFNKFSDFLAVLNNQSSKHNPRSFEFRNNFLRLKKLVLIGGPNDGVITPWQSSHFGMYNSSEVVLPMEEQKWYQNDAFGLKTLHSRGGIHQYTIPGVRHKEWYRNNHVFDTCIKPWLT